MGGKIYSYIFDIDLCDFYYILYFEEKKFVCIVYDFYL